MSVFSSLLRSSVAFAATLLSLTTVHGQSCPHFDVPPDAPHLDGPGSNTASFAVDLQGYEGATYAECRATQDMTGEDESIHFVAIDPAWTTFDCPVAGLVDGETYRFEALVWMGQPGEDFPSAITDHGDPTPVVTVSGTDQHFADIVPMAGLRPMENGGSEPPGCHPVYPETETLPNRCGAGEGTAYFDVDVTGLAGARYVGCFASRNATSPGADTDDASMWWFPVWSDAQIVTCAARGLVAGETYLFWAAAWHEYPNQGVPPTWVAPHDEIPPPVTFPEGVLEITDFQPVQVLQPNEAETLADGPACHPTTAETESLPNHCGPGTSSASFTVDLTNAVDVSYVSCFASLGTEASEHSDFQSVWFIAVEPGQSQATCVARGLAINESYLLWAVTWSDNVFEEEPTAFPTELHPGFTVTEDNAAYTNVQPTLFLAPF